MLEALDEWKARDRSAAYNSALICSVLCELQRDPKKKPQPFTPDDFLPRYERAKPKREAGAGEVAAKARSAMKILQKVNE